MEYDEEANRDITVGTYAGNKWGGKYLRSNDFLFGIIQNNLKGMGVRLKDRADVESGLYSGINDFFLFIFRQDKATDDT